MQECENCLAECGDRFCDVCQEIETALDDDADMYAGAY